MTLLTFNKYFILCMVYQIIIYNVIDIFIKPNKLYFLDLLPEKLLYNIVYVRLVEELNNAFY